MQEADIRAFKGDEMVAIAVFVLVLAAVFALIFLIMTYSMSRIKKQNTIETIRNENI